MRDQVGDSSLAKSFDNRFNEPVAVMVDEIIQASDGIMIARGDLGVEMPLEDVPIIQKNLLRHAHWHGKLAIIATQMLKVFSIAFNDAKAYESAVPRDEYIRKLLNTDTFIALVAMEGAIVVAGLAAYELKKFEQERSEIYIYDLAVLEEHRRKGIATALIKKLKGIAKDRGAYVIFVQADPGDDPAIKLYESLGTREDVHHFDIKTAK